MHTVLSLMHTSNHSLIPAWLKPGGMLVIESFHKDQLGRQTGGPQDLDMLYDEQILREDFKDLHIIEIRKKLEALDEGLYHQGEAALIRLFAKK